MNSDIPQKPSELSESRKQPTLKKEAKICSNCDLPIKGQFVRAVHAHFHLECFKCTDCGKIVAEKFFPIPPTSSSNSRTAGSGPEGSRLPQSELSTAQASMKTLIYCETDYFKRLDLLCARCGLALRGPYIRVGKQKYHMDHFSCSVCSTVFKQHDSYYEKDHKIYCASHFSILFAVRCGGCSTAVLKNFVETTKENKVTQWHPCCYSMSKIWGIKMNYGNQVQQTRNENQIGIDIIADEFILVDEVQIQKEMVERVETILHILSTFEESTAACVTEMLANFSNGNPLSGVSFARRLIFHIEVLFTSLENVDAKLLNVKDVKGFSAEKESRLLVKKIIHLFAILSDKKGTDEETVAATRDMIQLVTELSHLLKAVIRFSVAGATRLEQIYKDKQVMQSFLRALESTSTFDDDNLNMTSLALSLKNDDSGKKQIDDFFKPPNSLLVNTFQESSVKPQNGSLQSITQKEPLGQIGIENSLPYTQYICTLNASWADLYINFKIQEPKPLVNDGHSKDISQISFESPVRNSPLREEFFDDEEGNSTSPLQKMEHNRISGSGLNWKVTQEIDDKTPYLTEVSGLQFLATRQLAALALHRHLAKWFTLTKLLQIADGPKTSIWEKLFSKKDKKKIGCTFGSPLDFLVENYGVDSTLGFGFGQVRIPIIIQEFIIKLKQSGMTTEGIFRKNGNIRRLKEQCEEIDRDPKNINFHQDNEIQVAALLKKFLRDLPEPLMTETLYDLFLCVPKIDKKDDQVPVIQLIMCLLPKANIALLSVLVRFFVDVSANWSVHKMDLDNMATVIAPNILYTKLNSVEHTTIVIDVIRLLFQSHSSIFKVPTAIKDSLASAEENPISVEFVKKYEQNLSKTSEKQKQSGTHYSEGTAALSAKDL